MGFRYLAAAVDHTCIDIVKGPETICVSYINQIVRGMGWGVWRAGSGVKNERCNQSNVV